MSFSAFVPSPFLVGHTSKHVLISPKHSLRVPRYVSPIRILPVISELTTPQPSVETEVPTPDVQIPSISISAQPSDFSNASFVTNASGEWFGYQVTFSAKTGAPQPIPERFVPEEFSNWGVTINGFDALTSTTVTEEGTLFMRETLALPTVGCEADAIVPEVDESELPVLSAETRAVAFDDGSLCVAPTQLFATSLSQRWSVILAAGGLQVEGDDKEKRTRARISFGRVDEGVGKVVVFVERWDADYNGGSVLPGCGGAATSFADGKRVASDAANGDWQTRVENCSAESAWTVTASEEHVKREGCADGILALPKGLSLRIYREAGTCFVEAAWLVNDARRVALTAEYTSDGALVGIRHNIETRDA